MIRSMVRNTDNRREGNRKTKERDKKEDLDSMRGVNN